MNEINMLLNHPLPGAIFQTFAQKPHGPFFDVQQVHSSDLIVITEETPATSEIKADGLIVLFSGWKSRPLPNLMIKTADCLPVAIMGEKGYALVHAGWRGVEDQFFLHPELDKIAPYHFYLGPSIHQEFYEVGKAFLTKFSEIESRNGRFYLNLPGAAGKQIQGQYRHAQVERSPICTFQTESFYSYRRDQTTRRNWNLLIPSCHSFSKENIL
jgi:copper oxidase (laccase) domain-containing protein